MEDALIRAEALHNQDKEHIKKQHEQELQVSNHFASIPIVPKRNVKGPHLCMVGLSAM